LGDKHKIGKTEFLSLNPSYTGKRSLGNTVTECVFRLMRS